MWFTNTHNRKNTKKWHTIDALRAIFASLQYFHNIFTIYFYNILYIMWMEAVNAHVVQQQKKPHLVDR